MKFRKLEPSEIECRVSTIKANGLSLLLYKNARCDMNMLDEIVGAEYWQRDHKEVKGNVYCGVSIYCTVEEAVYEEVELNVGEGKGNITQHILSIPAKKEWITKWDAGAESYTEKVKGEASDSFKRACFNWGIGRELYTSPFIWIQPNKDGEFKQNANTKKHTTYTKFHVQEVAYTEDVISRLVIMDQNGKVRFTYGNKVNSKSSDELYKELMALGIIDEDMGKWLSHYNVDFEQELSDEQMSFIIERFNNQLGK